MRLCALISARSLADSFFARAFPPFSPPKRAREETALRLRILDFASRDFRDHDGSRIDIGAVFKVTGDNNT
jgi:hypothetical protein